MTPVPPAHYRFGRFTLDPAQRRLWKDAAPVELEAKVFDLIVLLLQNHPQAVSRQDAVEALWGHRPVTDTALSQLLYKARRALDDDGDRQAVIRTVYGRGLQWVVPVDEASSDPPRTVASDVSPAPAAGPQARSTNTPRPARAWRYAAAGLAAAVVVAAVLWAIPRANAPPGPERPRVAIAPLANATGETALDWTQAGIPALLASLLQQRGGLVSLNTDDVARWWGARGTGDAQGIRHVRTVSGADIVIEPRLTRLADQLYQLGVHVDRGRWHRAFDVSVQGDQPAQLATRLVQRIRTRLGLAPTPPAPLAFTTTHAYLAETFARGMAWA